jgi:ribonuclease HI
MIAFDSSLLKNCDVYCDGGVIGSNPSAMGGTWAFVLVFSEIINLVTKIEVPYSIESSGVITPADVDLPSVSNNVSEIVAALNALEILPADWAGTLYSDSLVP